MLTSVSYGKQAVVSKIKVRPFSSIMDVMEDLVEHVDLLFKIVSTVLTQ